MTTAGFPFYVPPSYSATAVAATISDIPDAILSNIIASVSDVRVRNAAALVCRKWRDLERATRTSLTLRGNLRDIFMVPTSFGSVTHLDLSLLSPWGNSLTSSASDAALIACYLGRNFPSVTSLTLYARNISTIQLLPSQWPSLKHVKLVRWHQRPQAAATGEELNALFHECKHLNSVDLSTFYCWTDDVPPALESNPLVASKLTSLNLLNPSFSEGFKSDEIKAITRSCPNLKEFFAVCMFDPRYNGFVGDEALTSIAVNCPKLAVLHLADLSALSDTRGDPEDDGFMQEDSGFSVATLIEVFSRLPLLEDLALDVSNNVRDSGPAFEMLNSKCPKLRSLKLGHFHGISMPIESKLDGIALCQGLESLSIRNVADLNDMGLIAIGRGCCRLAKFEVVGCENITMRGMRTLASLLCRTLIDVKISCCRNLDTVSSLKALEPIGHQIQRLHIDCVWDRTQEYENLNMPRCSFDLNTLDQAEVLNQPDERYDYPNGSEYDFDDYGNPRKKCKYSYDLNASSSMDINVNGNGFDFNNGNGYVERTWDKLKYLSLWIAVGQLLTPLPASGLEDCPELEEIRIKVEGDCRELAKPSEREFGLSTLMNYPKLSKMHLDCGDTIGYAQTAPSGLMDLSLWERFYLFGIGYLGLTELDYWPPQDRDVNQRSLSLPASGLLAECSTLRKLFIHGTAHEHFMEFFLKIMDLRDVQLREDYYPAPENDMSTEMRTDSCSRFEDKLNRRRISD